MSPNPELGGNQISTENRFAELHILPLLRLGRREFAKENFLIFNRNEQENSGKLSALP